MTLNLDPSSTARTTPDDRRDRFATLTFERDVAAPLSVLWQAWTAPAARAVWAAPMPSVTVEFLEADTKVGGREVSTADFSGTGECSRLVVTVQLSSLAEDMEAGYRQGFGAGLDNLAGAAERTMVLQRVIQAPRTIVWGAWMNPETLPQWWGPDGFSCRTKRIDLRTGAEWVFNMIAPDGTVFPNHHLYNEVRPEERIGYTLHWGENGPKHADAWASFEDQDGATKVTLGMVFSTAAEFQEAKGLGAVELGLQTLGKLERFVASR
jgi:uncharacterized protein YndB with AHSA1/START domain